MAQKASGILKIEQKAAEKTLFYVGEGEASVCYLQTNQRGTFYIYYST